MSVDSLSLLKDHVLWGIKVKMPYPPAIVWVNGLVCNIYSGPHGGC